MSQPSKQRCKRGREHDSESLEPASKHHCSRLEASPSSRLPIELTPPPTTSSPQHDKPSSRRPHTPNTPNTPNTPYTPPDGCGRLNSTQQASQAARPSSTGPGANWFLNHWLESLPRSRVIPEEVEGSSIVSTIEAIPGSQASCDQMSLHNAESTRASNSGLSERLKTSGSGYRAYLKMNGIVIDNFGDEIPRDVQQLVTKHIRKPRSSPPLEEDKKASIRQRIKDVWDSPEPTVSDIITAPLFDFSDPALAVGRDIAWHSKPLPQTPDYPLVAPKTDHHVGYQPTLKSVWTRPELAAADNPRVRPYSQPTRENLFPSFLLEVKSEATGGTLYGAEAQLATAGSHRVRSLMWVLDQIEPKRTRSSCDAIVFSVAICQREAIAHVHYYNPENETFYMSYIDQFYFAKDVQGCHDYVKNVVDWLLQIQQPIVRDALKNLHPITQLWKNPRSASSVADTGESSLGIEDSSESSKKQRLR